MTSLLRRIFVFMLPLLVLTGVHTVRAQVTTATAGTMAATGLSSDGTTLLGSYTINSGTPADHFVYFEYDIEQNLANPGTTDPSNPEAASGQFTATISGLEALTTYYYRACITNINQTGKACGATASFQTLSASAGSGSSSGTPSEDTETSTETSAENNSSGDSAGSGSSSGDSAGSGSSTGLPLDPGSSSDQSGGGTILSSDKLQNPLGGVNTIPELIAKILDIILKVAVPAIVLFIIYAGFLYVTARGDSKKIEAAHETLKYTILGAAIILAAWTIAQALVGTINKLK